MPFDFSGKLVMFENRLHKMYKHYGKIAGKQAIACFRVYDHDLPDFPFAIDIYGADVHAAEYKRRHGMAEDEHEAWLRACQEVIAQVLHTDNRHIFMKQRQRKAGRQGQYEKMSEAKAERIIQEHDLSFIINLTDYVDTGLFLDHRITRGMVRAEAAGKRVLNLFCYTGSFSVYAAKGGAAAVTSVDLSKTYIHWAKRNMLYNKLYQAEKHHFIQADVPEWIQTLPPASFDCIICDPPTFSNSKRMNDTFDVQRDHAALLRRLLQLLTDGGILYFSNNNRNFQLDSSLIQASEIKDITAATTPFDFQGRLHRACFRIRK